MTPQARVLLFLESDLDWHSLAVIQAATGLRRDVIRTELAIMTNKSPKLIAESDNAFSITRAGLAAIPAGAIHVPAVKKPVVPAEMHRAALTAGAEALEREFLARLATYDVFLSSDELTNLSVDLWQAEQRPRIILNKLHKQGLAEIAKRGRTGNGYRLTALGRAKYSEGGQ